MKRPTDETILAFLDGSLGADERDALLDLLDRDPVLAAEVRAAAVGLEAVQSLGPSGVVAPARGSGRDGPGISPWWAVAAAVATLLVSVPATWSVASGASAAGGGADGAGRPDVSAPTGGAPEGGVADVGAAPGRPGFAGGLPDAPEASYVLVLQGVWDDAAAMAPADRLARAGEYWAWTTRLAEAGVLVAAGDLRWEPGRRVGPEGVAVDVPGAVLDDPDYVVGMFALRVDSYEQALAIARDCPHLRYGGSVSVRRVGAGFVTVPGMDDWAD